MHCFHNYSIGHLFGMNTQKKGKRNGLHRCIIIVMYMSWRRTFLLIVGLCVDCEHGASKLSPCLISYVEWKNAGIRKCVKHAQYDPTKMRLRWWRHSVSCGFISSRLKMTLAVSVSAPLMNSRNDTLPSRSASRSLNRSLACLVALSRQSGLRSL